eukprot:78833-Pelagomonas_calceolata.AAC.4
MTGTLDALEKSNNQVDMCSSQQSWEINMKCTLGVKLQRNQVRLWKNIRQESTEKAGARLPDVVNGSLEKSLQPVWTGHPGLQATYTWALGLGHPIHLSMPSNKLRVMKGKPYFLSWKFFVFLD